MKCENCNADNNEKLNFCRECGNPLNEEARRLFPELVKPKK
jgi:predicted amidophosphoribosyltransferase